MSKVLHKGKKSVEKQSGQRNVIKAASQRHLKDLCFYKIILMIFKIIIIDNKNEKHYQKRFFI